MSYLKIKKFFSLRHIRDENTIRATHITNVICVTFVLMSSIALFAWLYSYLTEFKDIYPLNLAIISISILVIFILASITLLIVSIKGHPKISATILISLLLLATFRVSLGSGIDSPETLLIYALIIVMTSLVVGKKRSIIVTFLISFFLAVSFYLHQTGIIKIDGHWKNLPVTYLDILVFAITLAVIEVITWLYSHEIDKSLKNWQLANKKTSELARKLKRQNENLENIVNQRTKELREHQLKQLMEINNMAEYGKLSAGLLHDIKNPLTEIFMNLDSLKEEKKKHIKLKNSTYDNFINKSMTAANNVETIIKSFQKQLLSEDQKELVDINQEIKNTLVLFENRALRHHIRIIFDTKAEYKQMIFPTKLSRVVANLVMNSIDALKETEREQKFIKVAVNNDKDFIYITVEDNGCGIKKKNYKKIFDSLFTTKKLSENTGLGLFISKQIIKDYLKGEINFTSKYGEGTVFTLKIPFE